MRVTNPTAIRAGGYLVGTVLLVTAAVIFLAQVQVSSDAGDITRTCGSALDVAVGRVGWPEWWSQDLSDPEVAATGALLRTEECPDAINRQQLVAGVFAMAAAVAIAVTELLRSRFAPPSGEPTESLTLTRLGTTVFVVGVGLLLAGLTGIVLLVADPDDTLFLFVGRSTVALIGLVLLLPAIVLVIGGQVLRLTGKRLDERNSLDS